MKREFRILILPILEARSIIFDASHTYIKLYVTWIEIYKCIYIFETNIFAFNVKAILSLEITYQDT